MVIEPVTGPVPEGWGLLSLGDVIAQSEGGSIQTGPFGSQLHASDYVPVGIPTIMPVNIGENRIVETGIARITEADANRLSKHRVLPGDIIYSRRGDVERRALIRDYERGWLCGTGCLKVRLGRGPLDPLFTSFYLRHPSVRAWIVRHAVGATMPNLNTDIMSAIPVLVPPSHEQRAIAGVLGVLDDKIETNRKLASVLEGIARTVFNSWFVNFDSVRRKVGGQPTGLPADVAALFPSHLVDSPIGEVPEGWTLGTLGGMCAKPQYGLTASAAENMVGPQLLRITDINKDPWINWSTVPYCEIPAGEDAAKYRLRKGDLVIARMADPGHAALIEEDRNAVFASYLIRFRPLAVEAARYLQYWTRSPAYWDLVHGRKTGSTRATLNATELGELPLLVPPATAMVRFNELVDPLRARVVHAVVQSTALRGLRDALLPKLISGELRIVDAEKIVGSAGA